MSNYEFYYLNEKVSEYCETERRKANKELRLKKIKACIYYITCSLVNLIIIGLFILVLFKIDITHYNEISATPTSGMVIEKGFEFNLYLNFTQCDNVFIESSYNKTAIYIDLNNYLSSTFTIWEKNGECLTSLPTGNKELNTIYLVSFTLGSTFVFILLILSQRYLYNRCNSLN
jgi:hypothetical protein